MPSTTADSYPGRYLKKRWHRWKSHILCSKKIQRCKDAWPGAWQREVEYPEKSEIQSISQNISLIHIHYIKCVMEVLYSWSSMPPNHDFSNKNTAKKKFTQGTSDFSRPKHRPRGPPKARLPGWILALEKTNETEKGPNFIAKQKRKYDKILGCPRKLVNV